MRFLSWQVNDPLGAASGRERGSSIQTCHRPTMANPVYEYRALTLNKA